VSKGVNISNTNMDALETSDKLNKI